MSLIDKLFDKADKWLEESAIAREKARASKKASEAEATAYMDAVEKAQRYFGKAGSNVHVLTSDDYDTYVRDLGSAPVLGSMVKDFYANKPVYLKYSDIDLFNDLVNDIDRD